MRLNTKVKTTTRLHGHIDRDGRRRKRLTCGLAVIGVMSCLSFTVSADPSTGLTRETGAPIGDNQNSQTAGPGGGVLLQDMAFIEKLARFDRERIPERVVHARGTGAHGEFESYDNFSALTIAAPFTAKGKKTPTFVRFSTVVHSKGSPETLRDPRGFATKFYTDQGNWDLVGNNLPVFFIRDAIKFPDMVHSLKPSPVTNQQDPNRFFDFFSHVPESTQMLTMLYSDLGTPASYRTMDGNGVHAFKFVNAKGEVRYVKFNWKTLQGVKNLTTAEASEIQAKDFSHLTRDLYDAINKGEFPSWELSVQIMSPNDLEKFDFNPLDDTKEWPGVASTKLGRMTLNKVPDNFFAATEQSAFAPSVMIPGIEPSEDRMLQGRIFSYADTQRYRLGVNYQYLPVNHALSPINTHAQDGALSFVAAKGDINYQPNSFDKAGGREGGIYPENAAYKYVAAPLSGSTQQKIIAKTLNFRQAGDYFRTLAEPERKNLIANLSGDLGQVKSDGIRTQIVAHMYCADRDYGTRLAAAVGVEISKASAICDKINDDPQKRASINE